MIAFGAIGFILNHGQPAEAINKSKKLFLHTFLGLIIVLGSWFLVHVIIIVLTNNPKGQIFTYEWFNPSFCPQEAPLLGSDPLCSGKPDNTSCGARAVCHNGLCVSKCATKYINQPGYGCFQKSMCDTGTIEKLLCPDESVDIVCCKLK